MSWSVAPGEDLSHPAEASVWPSSRAILFGAPALGSAQPCEEREKLMEEPVLELDQQSEPSELVSARLTLGFGPVAVRFVGVEDRPSVRAIFPHTRFVLPNDAHADLSISCGFGDPAPRFGGEPVARGGGLWELRARDGEEEVCFFAHEGETRFPLHLLRLSPDLRSGSWTVKPGVFEHDSILLGYPVDQYLGARLISRAGGLILHASSIVHDGVAVVFIGHSGAGKSTISEIAGEMGCTVLTDDRTIVTLESGRAVAWGSPWHGTCRESTADFAPIGAMFLLIQDQREFIRDIEHARAFSEVFTRMVQPTPQSAEVVSSMDVVERLLHTCSLRELHFRPRQDAVRTALGAT